MNRFSFVREIKVSHLVSASPSNLNQLFTATGCCCYSPSSDFRTLTQRPFKRTANKHQTFWLNLGTTIIIFQCVCKFSTFVTSCFHWWPQTIILGWQVSSYTRMYFFFTAKYNLAFILSLTIISSPFYHRIVCKLDFCPFAVTNNQMHIDLKHV